MRPLDVYQEFPPGTIPVVLSLLVGLWAISKWVDHRDAKRNAARLSRLLWDARQSLDERNRLLIERIDAYRAEQGWPRDLDEEDAYHDLIAKLREEDEARKRHRDD